MKSDTAAKKVGDCWFIEMTVTQQKVMEVKVLKDFLFQSVRIYVCMCISMFTFFNLQ